MVQLTDTLDEAMTARICADGCLVADVKAARIGIQTYLPSEAGAPSTFTGDVVRVFRPEEEVFSRDSMASFAAAPFTIDHPSQPVTAANWRQLGVGEVNGDVVRDGGFVRVPVIVRDAASVEKVRTTHKQLSMGYGCTLDWTPGVTPDGQAYDAVQREIRINHIAAVRAARGGPELKISDERPGSTPLADGVSEAISLLKKAISLHEKHMNGTAPTTGAAGEKSQKLMMLQMMRALSELESDPSEKPMKMDALVYGENTMKIKIGDAEVDATNGEAVRIAVDALNVKLGGLTADNATLKTSVEAKDGEIAALNAKLKDAEVTPERLQKLADARADVIGKAKLLAPSIVTDGKLDAEIRKEAVTAKLGDAAKDMADAAIEGAFLALTKDAKAHDPLRTALSDGIRQPVNDAAVVSTIRNARYA